MTSTGQTPKSPAPRPIVAFLLLALIALFPFSLPAQPPEPVPLRPMFGVGDNEFFKGAWVKIKPGDPSWSYRKMVDSIGFLWTLCDSLGLNVIRYQMDEVPEILTSLAQSPRRRPRHRLITSEATSAMDGTFQMAPWGRELILYPFNTAGVSHDSVQFRDWPVYFTTLRGGVAAKNRAEVNNWNQPADEQHYQRATTEPGTVIAEGIGFNRYPQQTGRWPTYRTFGGWRRDYSDTILETETFLGPHMIHTFPYSTHYVTITARLAPGDRDGDPGEKLLRVEVFHEIPGGSRYFTDTASADRYAIADENITRRIATIDLTRGDLLSRSPADPLRYAEISLPWDARLNNGIPGPLYNDALGATESQRFDIKVTWLAGDLYLRSIALRDSIGELMLGQGPRSDMFRARALLGARYSYSDSARSTTYRWPIIARVAGQEQVPLHAGALDRLNKLLRDNIVVYDSLNHRIDSLPLWTELMYTREFFTRHDDPSLTMPAVVTELTLGIEDWIARGWGGVPPNGKLPHNGRIPSIRQHNGGRWTLPLLTLDPFDIEHRYETLLQFAGFKVNAPDRLPPLYERSHQLAIGRAAEVARDQGRRLIVVPFCVGAVMVNSEEKEIPKRGAIMVTHFPEPSEMRAMANLALCYGARGLMWQQLQAHHGFYSRQANDAQGPFTWGYTEDFGVTAPFTDGKGSVGGDLYDPLRIGRGTGADGGFYRDSADGFELDSFYTGWIQRSAAMKQIHARIDRLWPQLSQLRWHSGYSIHFATEPGFPYTINPIPYRPIAPDEIVSRIRTRRPESALYDSAQRTFVELGIFYLQRGEGADSLQETNHIFLVNRRCFERTGDIPATSPEGRRMDTLAEVRTIEVRLNLRHPIDSSGGYPRYRFVHIREIVPEGDTLPLAHAPRLGLDTIVHRDSAFAITLGPGRGALVRIRYLLADPSLINEVLDENRKRTPASDERWDSERFLRSTITRRFAIASSAGGQQAGVVSHRHDPSAYDHTRYRSVPSTRAYVRRG